MQGLLDKGNYACGTVRMNRQGFPTALKKPAIIQLRGDFKILQKGNTNLTATVWNDKRLVHLLTTLSDSRQTFTVLKPLFHLVEKALPKKQLVDKFQFVILSLMKCRLNLPLQFLAYEFSISISSALRYFAEAVNILYVKLGPVIQWPEREQLRQTMPMQFLHNFGNKVAVIIDCFEILQ